MDGAYFTAWADFRRNLGGILLLAIGAVAFTTLLVGLVARWIVPDLPWAACFALGAVVSPPDAIAAKAVLERVALPRPLMVLLEGENLLNDAAGLVLFRFAVAAAMTGAFSIGDAVVTFSYLAVGGLAVGGALGFLWVKSLRLLNDPSLTIVAAVLLPWAAYIGG
jgi:CPA1 family monovalent cation:H+ antiporter